MVPAKTMDLGKTDSRALKEDEKGLNQKEEVGQMLFQLFYFF